ncbi:MAG: hypothetical protein ACP5SF_05045 [Thermoplasmata archaeon]
MPEIYPAKSPDDIRKGLEVIKDAWGATDILTIMKDLLTGIRSNGGLVLLAYEGDEIVGISFAFIGYKKNFMYLYSHMTGIKNLYKYKNLGLELKKKQRQWALEHNLELISWTFDPLQGLNSNFNLRKLGAFSRCYRRNHYGIMTDSLNYGMRSDRVVAEWCIKSKEVEKRLSGKLNEYNNLEDAILTIEKNDYRIPKDLNKNIQSKVFRIEIPRDIIYIKKKNLEDAIIWRDFSAEIYENYFSRGYALIDFYTKDFRNFQVVSKDFPKECIAENIFQD